MATINPFQGPINYSVDVQSPFEAALGGFKIGAAGAEIQAQQQKRDLEIQAAQQAQQRQTELSDLFKNPNATSADYERVVAFLPKDQAAIVTGGFERKTKEQQDNDLRMGAQVYSAIKSGQPNIAMQMLTDQAAAFRNSGRENEAKAAEASAQAIELNPTMAQATVGLYMATLPGGTGFLEAADKALATIRAEAKAPSELKTSVANADKAVSDAEKALSDAIAAQETAKNAPEKAKADAAKATADALKAKADAQKAEVDAEFARAKSVLEVQQQAATLRKTDADILIAKENNRIAALNAAQAKETNVLRRQELQQKIDDATKKRDETDRDQRANIASQAGDIDNFINTATQILKIPDEVIKSASGPITARLPTLSQNVADLEALVETAGSQIFLAVIPKMKSLGALSEKEGDKLQTSLTNLSLKQSPEQFKANMKEAVRLMEKARVNLELRSGRIAPPMDIPARELNVTVGGTTYNFPTKAAADAFRNSDAYRRAAGNR